MILSFIYVHVGKIRSIEAPEANLKEPKEKKKNVLPINLDPFNTTMERSRVFDQVIHP